MPPRIDAPAVALPADDDRGDEQDRQQQREAVRVDEALLAGEQRAGEAADEGAHREGQQLEPEGRHAHQLGGVLVLAGRLPGPADAAVLDQHVEDQHDDDHHEREPVVRDLVADAELQERGRGVRGRRPATRCSSRGCGTSNSSTLGGRGTSVMPGAAAEPVRVDSGEPDDLAEAERDDGEVVAAHPQRRGAQDDAGDHRGDHRDRHARAATAACACSEPRTPTV